MRKLLTLYGALAALALLVLFSGISVASVAGVRSCDIIMNSSSSSSVAAGLPGCASFNVTYENGVSSADLYCSNATISNSSSIVMAGNNHNDRIYNCTVSNPKIELYGNSSLDIIGSANPKFKPLFIGPNSNVTVGYFLTVNIYEPEGYNSSKTWGEQLTHYSYILPTINNTFPINNTQLQMVSSFSPQIQNLIERLKARVPFGLYNETNSTIYLSKLRNESYGTIYGSKTYTLPSYTVNATSTTYYSPYNVEYSFFAFDQLIMFKVNMTSNLNITPLYIQPLYPPFNFKYIPNAPNGMFTIRWLISVPPQDSNWTFNYHIYRYNTMQGFTVDPLNTSIGPYASFVNLLDFPPQNYTPEPNQSKTYIFNYTSKLGIGLNSSITIANGTADSGKVSYIQDSTTPSFSQGIGYCSSIFNGTTPMSIVNQSGYYTMVSGYLRPLGGPALPVLFTAPCSIGTYIKGDNITIMCNQSIINDTGKGIVISDSKNVNLFYCAVKGNGIYIYNSTNVIISNTRVLPGLVNNTGILVSSSNDIKFVNFGVYNGFAIPFNETNSQSVQFYNLSSTNQSTISYIENRTIVNGAFVLSNAAPLTSTAARQPFHLSQHDYLYLGALIVVAIYIYLFFKIQYKPNGQRKTGSKKAVRHVRKRKINRKATRAIMKR